MGKVLWVDLSKGTLKDEALDEKIARTYIGGYGIRFPRTLRRMKAKADPLGPDNILGFMTGPCTGAPRLTEPLHGLLQVPAHERLGRRQLGRRLRPRAQVRRV